MNNVRVNSCAADWLEEGVSEPLFNIMVSPLWAFAKICAPLMGRLFESVATLHAFVVLTVRHVATRITTRPAVVA